MICPTTESEDMQQEYTTSEVITPYDKFFLG